MFIDKDLFDVLEHGSGFGLANGVAIKLGVFAQPGLDPVDGDDRTVADLLVFRTNGNPLEKPGWHHVKLLSTLLADSFPEFWVFLHLVRLDHDSLDREIFGDFCIQRLALTAS